MLSEKERERYRRQIVIDDFGEAGQEKLARARVLIAGAGGLGSPAAFYLAAAGVGTIRIVDEDRVETSNLNRQILHWDADTGQEKAASAGEKLARLNPGIAIEAVTERITKDNAARLAEGCDLIIDAMDNLPTRYLLNRTAVSKNIPFCHGAVRGFEGRAMTVLPGETACLNCLYRGALTPPETTPVLGATAGIIGCIQATEAIKYLVGTGKLLRDTLLVYDGLEMTFTRLSVSRDPDCAHCGKLYKK